MPIIVNVLSSFQPKTSRQNHCIKRSCINLGEGTNSLVSVCNILPGEYFGRVFYFTASLTQGIFALRVIEPDTWIHFVPSSAVVSGGCSHLPVTVGRNPERLLSAAERHPTETLLPHSGFCPRRGWPQRALPKKHPRGGLPGCRSPPAGGGRMPAGERERFSTTVSARRAAAAGGEGEGGGEAAGTGQRGGNAGEGIETRERAFRPRRWWFLWGAAVK